MDPDAIGLDESEYGANGNSLGTDLNEQTAVRTLGPAIIRLSLNFATAGDPSSGVVCKAGGCVTGASGDQYVAAVVAAGAIPEVQVDMHGYLPYSSANQATYASDAAALVTHFNKTAGNNPSPRWLLGNEPDASDTPLSAANYSSYFNAAVTAMKAVDPTLRVGGPVTASFNQSFITTFLQNCGGVADFVDFHSYGEGGTTCPGKTDAALLAETAKYGQDIGQAQGLIRQYAPGRTMTVQVGEWNLSWASKTCSSTTNVPVTEFYQGFNIVWSASVLGHILSAGGLSLPFASKNGALGALFEEADSSYPGSGNDTPMPLYHGLGMFTGEGIFRGFGTAVVASGTRLTNVEVFASANPQNLVVVNKDPSVTYASATFSLAGASGSTVDVHQENQTTGPFGAPAQLGTMALSGGSFSYDLPPYSVTTFLVQ